jgi:hypothetical protein
MRTPLGSALQAVGFPANPEGTVAASLRVHRSTARTSAIPYPWPPVMDVLRHNRSEPCQRSNTWVEFGSRGDVVVAINLVNFVLLQVVIPIVATVLVLGLAILLARRAGRELARRWRRGPSSSFDRAQLRIDALATGGWALFIERNEGTPARAARRAPSPRLSSLQRLVNGIATGGWTLFVEDKDLAPTETRVMEEA